MVAKLAGIPNQIIKEANVILNNLEKSNNNISIDTLPLFQDNNLSSDNDNQKPNNSATAIYNKISEINPDNLTPKQALEILYDLKNETN